MRRTKQRGNAQNVTYTKADATYDKQAKAMLANRQMLALVLQRVVPEFRDVSLEEIQDHCIDGEPQIGTVPVASGKTNRRRRRAAKYIRGRQTEDSVLGEGWVTFDILFYARVPSSGKRIKLIINVEAQRNNTDYSLTKRAFFYASRLISSQKEREFVGEDYDDICKVYTIWLCFYLPKGQTSSITHYEFHEVCDVGNFHERKENYDLINVTVIHIGHDEKTDTLLKFLYLVFMSNFSEEEREKRLEKDFGMELWDETREGLSDMCNLSIGMKEWAREEGLAEGRAEGRAEGEKSGRTEEQKDTILRLLKSGKGIDIMAAATGWTIEHVQTFLKSQNLQPAQ